MKENETMEDLRETSKIEIAKKILKRKRTIKDIQEIALLSKDEIEKIEW